MKINLGTHLNYQVLIRVTLYIWIFLEWVTLQLISFCYFSKLYFVQLFDIFYLPHHFEQKILIGTSCPVAWFWLQQQARMTQPSISQPFYFWYSVEKKERRKISWLVFQKIEILIIFSVKLQLEVHIATTL